MIIKDTDEPELYLFFSVDIIDSTTLNYGTKDKPSLQNWYNSILTFYEEFPTQFQVALDSVTSIFHLPSNIQLSTWKYSGDEILFFINIKNENEVPASIFAFERLLNEWYDPTDVKQIHLKGCAWIGQFPFIDRRLSIKQSDTDQNSKLDFIGPSIDCGFRLGKYASRNQIVLSVEIVDLCRVCTDFSLNLYYLKSENLKGVLGTLKYPIFVLVLSKANKSLEEQHLLHACHATDLKVFIDDYYTNMIEEHKNKVSKIDSHINNYLQSKKELSKNIISKDKAFDSESNMQEPETEGAPEADLNEFEHMMVKSVISKEEKNE